MNMTNDDPCEQCGGTGRVTRINGGRLGCSCTCPKCGGFGWAEHLRGGPGLSAYEYSMVIKHMDYINKRDDQIKERLRNISRKMDWVEMDPVIREYLDIQVTNIHRMLVGSETSSYDGREQEILEKLEDLE